MVNDILERWAIVDKPRTYTDWVHQYQEMLETLPRQEAAQQHIKHYISKETLILIEEKFRHWNDAYEAERQAMTNKVRQSTRKDKLQLHLKSSILTCHANRYGKAELDFAQTSSQRCMHVMTKEEDELHWTKGPTPQPSTYRKSNGVNQNRETTHPLKNDT